MFNFFTILQRTRLSAARSNLAYSTYFERSDQKEIEKIFTRVFSTEDGKKALAYLQYITFQRAHSQSAPKEQLYYAEGQRALVGNILRLAERGKH
jgi:hypothetical protein